MRLPFSARSIKPNALVSVNQPGTTDLFTDGRPYRPNAFPFWMVCKRRYWGCSLLNGGICAKTMLDAATELAAPVTEPQRRDQPIRLSPVANRREFLT